MMSPRFRSVSPTLVFLFSILLMLWSCGGDEDAKKAAAPEKAPPAVPIRAMAPVSRDVPVFGEFVGRTDAKETVEIRARVEGFLKTRLFEEGSLVKAGDVLFEIESRQYDEAMRRAQADLDRQQALLAKAATDLSRFEALFKQQAISRDEYDTKVTSQKDMAAQADRAKAELETARRDLSYTKVVAPISGRIGKSLVKPGTLVGKGENTLLAEISSTDPIYVDFNISEREYLLLVKDMVEAQKQGKSSGKAELTLILADDSIYPHTGEAEMADRAVDSKTGTLPVRASFPNPDGILKPGQFAKVRALVDTLAGVLCVPRRAVVDVQGVKTLYVVGPDGTVEAKSVTLGPVVEDMVAVLKGLAPTDAVIVDGVQKIRPGIKVAAQSETQAAGQPAAAKPAGN
ncbi:efflux RND transporter periplasmic adaptor subunit [Desulfolutivibrio sp.]|uniref:efflux RND transporter periplasmic adaptor subunit n=1 Tax=Desulfolutivibrio sp. TaxID=2773296 RepID=UPI002F969F20